MPASLDCVLCLARQSLEAARHATDDPAVHETILRRALDLVRERGFTEIPPVIAREIQRIVREVSGNPDPYLEQKRAANRQMLEQVDLFREILRNDPDPFGCAVRLAIAGNSIDNALGGHLSREFIRDAIEKSLRQPVIGPTAGFAEMLDRSRSLLYLADNCGEIVCDRLLIEEIRKTRPGLSITVVVRGAAVINDATLADAAEVGLTELVPVIDNGNDAVGTVLEQGGEAFQQAFRAADLVVSKGLANYETLIEYGKDALPQPVVYLFKVKCPFIARLTGTRYGDLVCRIGRAVPAS